MLAFDYHRLGESGGMPRQLVHIGDHLADWNAAIDRDKLAIWGFSASGGHVFSVAAHNPSVAAAIAHSPRADGIDAMRNALRHTTPRALARLTGRAADFCRQDSRMKRRCNSSVRIWICRVNSVLVLSSSS